MQELMTIGYEGLTLAQFLQCLNAEGVQTLVDVRELPLSRKPGFSKAALCAAIQSVGITYVHVAALGCPRDVRHEYKVDRDWLRYGRRFTDYLQTQTAAIALLAERARNERCCLLCFEADPHFCHRTFVAEAAATLPNSELVVRHLTALNPVPIERETSAVALAGR